MIMTNKYCITISYHGEQETFTCNEGCHYEDIIGMATTRFEVNAHLHEALMLTTDDGYVFDKHLLEYFLLLFPKPQLIFNLRVNYGAMRRSLRTPPRPRSVRNSAALPARHSATSAQIYHAVAVHRQNAFLGTLPSRNDPSEMTDDERTACTLHRMRVTALEEERRKEQKRAALKTSRCKRPIRI